MGIPSISIYVTELFKDFDVQTAIRIGTCGGLGKTQLRDVIIGMAAFVLVMPLMAPFLEASLHRGLGLAFSFGK